MLQREARRGGQRGARPVVYAMRDPRRGAVMAAIRGDVLSRDESAAQANAMFIRPSVRRRGW